MKPRTGLPKSKLRKPFLVTVSGAALVGASSLIGACFVSNPPGPEESACPTEEPVGQTTCSRVAAAGCGYGPLCGGSPTKTYSCTNGTWSVSEVSCNPPAPIPDAGGDARDGGDASRDGGADGSTGDSGDASTDGSDDAPSDAPNG